MNKKDVYEFLKEFVELQHRYGIFVQADVSDEWDEVPTTDGDYSYEPVDWEGTLSLVDGRGEDVLNSMDFSRMTANDTDIGKLIHVPIWEEENK